MLSISIMWIFCGYNTGTSNSHLEGIAACLPSGEDLPFFQGADTGVLLPSLLCLGGCLLVAEQDHLLPLSHRAVAGAVPPVRTQQEAGVAQSTCWEKP